MHPIRFRLRLRLTTSLWVLLALAAASCDDKPATAQDAGGADAQWIDARPDAAEDAALPDAALPDATLPDATLNDAAVDGGAPQPVRVLFLGNSYTAANDLPGRVVSMAQSAGLDPPLVEDRVTVGGARLQDHLNTPSTVTLIQTGSWDFVVLQGQSVEALYDPTGFHTAAAALAVEIVAAGAVPMFFETWARQAGHAVYVETWSGGTPAAMQAGLRDEYNLAATNSGGQVAPVGDAWELTLAAHPGITLFTGDGSHPSAHGTYLAACVFYLRLTGAPLADTAALPATVSTADATALRQTAEQAVSGP